MKTPQTERRKHQRYATRNNSFAVIGSDKTYLEKIKKGSMGEIACAVYKSNPMKLGKIIDMSQGGLAFSYIERQGDAEKIRELDILSADNRFYLEKILFKTVMDAESTDEPAFSPFKLKHQRIQFLGLTPDQKEKLTRFLNRCTACGMARA